MSYEPIKQPESDLTELKEIELEGSETDVEANPAESEGRLLLRWKRDAVVDGGTGQSLYQRALKANIPVVISLHLLAFNFILSVALGTLLWRACGTSGSGTKGQFAPGELMYTVGQDVIEHRVELGYVGPGYSTGFKASPYQGWPDDEKDRLWKKYEDGNHIRLTAQEAAQLSQPTIHVPQEEYKDDYLVGLVVFHHLHCISALRRAIYPRRYGSSLYGEDGKVDYEAWHHVDHCIEIIRSYLECHPDMTAMNFEWLPGSTIAVYPTTLHTCRNFDVLSDWVYERSVDVPIRANLEGGRVVDYTGRPYGSEYNETWVLKAPEGWNYTKDDM